MTFAEMKQEVYRRLAEGAGTAVFWSLDDVETALNDGLMELSDATEWFEDYVDVDLLTDRPYYDLRAILGETFLAIGPAFDRQTNKWLLPTSVRNFDAHERRWERVTGEPQRILMQGLWWLGYWPRIQTAVGTIRQNFTSLPDPMVLDTDEPGFPDLFHYGVVNFALTDLWAQDGETARALLEWQAYLTQETGLKRWVEGRAGDAAMHGYGAIGSVAR